MISLRSTYAPMVFDKEDTSNPVIKPSVIKMIEDQLADFEKEYPVLKYTLIGSILTHRYRNDADLDINVLFDVPVEKREDERVRLSKKYLSAKNPDNIQVKKYLIQNILSTTISSQTKRPMMTRTLRQMQSLILRARSLSNDQMISSLI